MASKESANSCRLPKHSFVCCLPFSQLLAPPVEGGEGKKWGNWVVNGYNKGLEPPVVSGTKWQKSRSKLLSLEQVWLVLEFLRLAKSRAPRLQSSGWEECTISSVIQGTRRHLILTLCGAQATIISTSGIAFFEESGSYILASPPLIFSFEEAKMLH